MSQRLGPPPVDPLPDLSWARIERNVFARSEGTVTNAVAAREIRPDLLRGSWMWLAVPAAAAAAFGLTFFSMNGPPPAPAAGEPSRVAAGAAPSTVSYGDAHVTLQAHSAVLLEPDAGRPTALLEDGSAVFAVAPRGERAPFVVLAGDLSARTASATFTVTRHGERADVAVNAGTVEVRFRGHDARVAAGQAWSSDRPDVVRNVGESSGR